jgi:hypothetical protein
VVTAKDVTQDEREFLNGHVAAILQKGSLPAVELLTWLKDAIPQSVAPQETLNVGG